jgi:hypothetical protein
MCSSEVCRVCRQWYKMSIARTGTRSTAASDDHPRPASTRGAQVRTLHRVSEPHRLRTPVERLGAHFKSWRIFHTDHRCPYRTYRDAYDAACGLSSSQLHGVLNKTQSTTPHPPRLRLPHRRGRPRHRHARLRTGRPRAPIPHPRHPHVGQESPFLFVRIQTFEPRGSKGGRRGQTK